MNKTIHDFNQLPIAKRAMLVNNYGKTIHWTEHNNYRITLYEIDAMFIEVWFDLDSGIIWEIRMPNYEELDIHLKEITI